MLYRPSTVQGTVFSYGLSPLSAPIEFLPFAAHDGNHCSWANGEQTVMQRWRRPRNSSKDPVRISFQWHRQRQPRKGKVQSKKKKNNYKEDNYDNVPRNIIISRYPILSQF